MLTGSVFCGKEVTLNEVLLNKERRAALQREALSRRPACIVSFSLNIPGPVKQFPLARKAFEDGEAALRRGFGGDLVPYSVCADGVTGPEAIFLSERTGAESKAVAVGIEESHPLGRLFDMDILSPDGAHVSRTDSGAPARRCLLCGNDARVCGRSRAHSVPEMQDKIAAMLEDFFTVRAAGAAADTVQRAMLYELSLTPKPGLVDLRDSGAHRDMDMFTFIDSTVSLRDFFADAYTLGRKNADGPADALFILLRRRGKRAEEAMLSATGGVNTHKGFLFSAGILCAALGQKQAGTDRAVSRQELREAAAALGQCALGDFKENGLSPEPYRRYGVKGAREEAALAFPSVFDTGLPVLRQALEEAHTLRFAALKTLLALMAQVADSNIYRRAGREEAALRRQQARLMLESITEDTCLEILDRLNAEYIRANISPGGSADLLALSLMLRLWEQNGYVRPA